jgi:hypothetical protein
MKLFYFFLRSLGPNVVVTKHLSYTTKAVYNDAVCEHKGSIKLKRKGKTMSDGPSVALQAIVERLVLLSESQKLIEEAKGGYAGWYANESDEMPHKPEDVQMEFWRQTLYFQPGSHIQLKPYIDTALKMVVQDQEFGYYRLITSLDGAVDDDYIVWGEPLFYQFPDDHRDTNPIGPIDTSVGIPENMRDMFPRLSHLAKQQKLLQRAERRCAAWFQEHPLWFQQYPQSLVEEGTNPNRRWFHDHPIWFQGYPSVPFPNGHEVRIGFDRQLLCFNHAEFLSPHILTTLDVFAGGYEIGEYCLATDVNGTVIEDLSGIFPFPFSL